MIGEDIANAIVRTQDFYCVNRLERRWYVELTIGTYGVRSTSTNKREEACALCDDALRVLAEAIDDVVEQIRSGGAA